MSDKRNVRVSYEVWQDDMCVAVTEGDGAAKEARHYLAQYAQDGEAVLYQTIRSEVGRAGTANKGAPNG